MFEIYKDNAGEFRFRLKAGNGQNILASEGYTSKDACENGIASVKENAQIPERFALEQSENGQWHFNLTAGNHQVIGTSQMYDSKEAAQHGMESVAKNAKGEVMDSTQE